MECQIKFLYCWLDMKTNYPLSESNCIFASDFRSFAGAPISLDVLLHVLEVVLQLLDPVWSSCGSDRQLVPVVPDVNQDHDRGDNLKSLLGRQINNLSTASLRFPAFAPFFSSSSAYHRLPFSFERQIMKKSMHISITFTLAIKNCK